ncbi:hypothetical protein Hanom_Chr07g00672881 [Helianthus anomalus]
MQVLSEILTHANNLFILCHTNKVPQLEPPPSQSPHHHEQSLLMTCDRRPP